MALTDGVFNVGGFKRLPKARSIFGIQIPKRTGRGLLAGFANMPQVQAGGGFGGNFLAGLQGGLQGSLAGVGQFDQMQQMEMERQAQAERQQRALALQEAAQAETQRYHTGMLAREPSDPVANALRLAELKKQRPDLFPPDQASDPVANALRLAEMKKAHPELFPEADPFAQTETTILERDPVTGYPTVTRSRRYRESQTDEPKGFTRSPAAAYDPKTGAPISSEDLDTIQTIREASTAGLQSLDAIAADPARSSAVRRAAKARAAALRLGAQ